MALQLIDTIHLVLRMLLGPPAAPSQVPPPLTVPSQRCPRRAARPLTDRCVRARCGRLPYISASRLRLDAQAAASPRCCVLASTSSRTQPVRLAAVAPRRAFRMFVCVCNVVARVPIGTLSTVYGPSPTVGGEGAPRSGIVAHENS